MIPEVDLVILTRCEGAIHPEVERGIKEQLGVRLHVHRIVGRSAPEDVCRWDAIARARNEGITRGTAPWLMFLDDDVVLAESCIRALVDELARRPAYAALAADYLDEHRPGQMPPHVAMGATLFRRDVLRHLHFRWRDDRCECQCCCDDLRRRLWGIDYHVGARARHLKPAALNVDHFPCHSDARHSGASVSPAGRELAGVVLAAFDRRHFRLFRGQFLPSLRRAGNAEVVKPLAFGLYPSQQRRLALLPGVQPSFRRATELSVARRRLSEFQDLIAQLPSNTPVAYWDAGDVVFQDSLAPLWQLVRSNPTKLLVVSEPAPFLQNEGGGEWTQSIADPSARRYAFDLFATRPFLNAGFAAGTASALLKYFQTVSNWYDSVQLKGSTDWGDQIALNLYCHSQPTDWMEINEGWNYCLALRRADSIGYTREGRLVDTRGVPIHVIHGNARTLPGLSWSRTSISTFPATVG